MQTEPRDHDFGGTAGKTRIKPNGSLVFIDAAGLVHACIHGHDVNDDIALALQDTWYQITSFDENGEYNNATPDHTNNHIVIEKVGTYLVNAICGCHSAAANDYQIQVRKNNGVTGFDRLTGHTTTAVAGRVLSVPSSAIIRLEVGDTLEVWVMRTDGGAVVKTFTVDHIGLDILQVGG